MVFTLLFIVGALRSFCCVQPFPKQWLQEVEEQAEGMTRAGMMCVLPLTAAESSCLAVAAYFTWQYDGCVFWDNAVECARIQEAE